MMPSVGYSSTGSRRQFAAAFIGNLSAFCIGNMLGWTSPVQGQLESGQAGMGNLTSRNMSWIGSINFLGAATGSFFWGWLSDKIGRKKTALCVAIPFATGWLIILLAPAIACSGKLAALLVGRVLLGVGCSGVLVNMPSFVTEIAEDSVRGRLGSLLMFSLTAGTLYSYLVGSVLQYKGLTIACLAVPIFYAISFSFMPESPVWYVSKSRLKEAENSLLWYRGNDREIVEAELQKLCTKSKPKKGKDLWERLQHLWSSRGTIKAVAISFGFILGQQLCGILGISTFAVKIFTLSGGNLQPHVAAVVIGCVQLISAATSSLLVDKAGRRALLVASFSTMGGALILLAMYFLYRPNHLWLPVTCLSFHFIAYSLGAGPVPFVVMAEIFSPEIRGTAISFIQFFSTVFSFISVKMFPTIMEVLGPEGCFFFFGVCNILEMLFVIFFVPETKGKPLNWILQKLEGTVSCQRTIGDAVK